MKPREDTLRQQTRNMLHRGGETAGTDEIRRNQDIRQASREEKRREEKRREEKRREEKRREREGKRREEKRREENGREQQDTKAN